MIDEFSIFQESVPAQYQDLFDKAQHHEMAGRVLNEVIKIFDKRSMKEVDAINAQVDQRGEEITKINEVIKNLLGQFEAMEQCIKFLEEEGLEREDMVVSLQVEVDDLKTKVCHCTVPQSRPLSREGSREVPFELEYASDSEYIAPFVVTALVPIDMEVVHNPSLALRFGDDEEEGLIIVETRESSPSVADPQENDVPIPVQVSSPPPVYQELVCSGQCCIHLNGPLKKLSFYPYHCSDTFMGMPAGLHSTKDLRHNLKRLQQTGSSHKCNSARSGSLSSETSYGNVTDRSIDLGPRADVGGVSRHPTSPEV